MASLTAAACVRVIGRNTRSVSAGRLCCWSRETLTNRPVLKILPDLWTLRAGTPFRAWPARWTFRRVRGAISTKSAGGLKPFSSFPTFSDFGARRTAPATALASAADVPMRFLLLTPSAYGMAALTDRSTGPSVAARTDIALPHRRPRQPTALSVDGTLGSPVTSAPSPSSPTTATSGSCHRRALAPDPLPFHPCLSSLILAALRAPGQLRLLERVARRCSRRAVRSCRSVVRAPSVVRKSGTVQRIRVPWRAR